MIKNKFSGYTRDGIRRLFDPATVAAFTAGMEGATAATAATAAGTAATGAALGAGAGALSTMGAAAAPEIAAAATQAPQLATAMQAGAIAPDVAGAGQGIMQGGAAAAPTATSTIPGAVGATPAGDTAAMGLNQVGGMTPPPPAGGQPGFGAPITTPPAPVTPTASSGGGMGGIMDGLTKGFNTAMEFAKEHPFYTTAGLYAAQKSGIFGGGMEEEGGKHKGSVDMSGFRGWEPNPTFRGFADGGPVETMSNMNAMGGNMYYPMSQQPHVAYANPGIQNPISQNVLDVGEGGRLDPYTGMPAFAEGGKTESFYKQVMREDEERMAQARRSMRDHTPDISGPGIMQRTLTQQQKRPDEAAKLQLAGIAKQAGVKLSDMPKANVPEDFTYEAARGGIMHGDLGGYSDGGRLLRGPGDGVSDSIPAKIGDRQPARLADGEFVVPARIVSELGNGSTEAGARQLYSMMDRVQKRRKKSIGKDKVAVDSKAHKDLPV